MIVRDLQAGRDTTFGNISEYAWQNTSPGVRLKPDATKLALAVSAEDKTGNGVQLYDAATGSHRVLDSGSAIYTGLAWRRDADDLVVLKAQTDEKREGSTHVVLAWSGVATGTPKLHTLDPTQRQHGVGRYEDGVLSTAVVVRGWTRGVHRHRSVGGKAGHREAPP